MILLFVNILQIQDRRSNRKIEKITQKEAL